MPNSHRYLALGQRLWNTLIPRMTADNPKVSSLLVLELWGLGDLALAIPFLRRASEKYRVTLLAKPQAAPVLTRFAPEIELLPLTLPWTAFSRKYRLWEWDWPVLRKAIRELRQRRFTVGVSARRDPRDHVLLHLAGCGKTLGFARLGSGMLLDQDLPVPASEHRAAYWNSLATVLGLEAPAALPRSNPQANPRSLIIHTGAGHPVRRWPVDRWRTVASELGKLGWTVTLLEDDNGGLDSVFSQLEGAARFVGSDSGPGHLAALLGIPTFTLFGPQLPSRFAPPHSAAAWHPGAPCRFKPCHDSCRLQRPECMLRVSAEELLIPLKAWLAHDAPAAEDHTR